MNNNDSFRNRQNGFETMDGGAPGKKQKTGNFGKIIGTVARSNEKSGTMTSVSRFPPFVFLLLTPSLNT